MKQQVTKQITELRHKAAPYFQISIESKYS